MCLGAGKSFDLPDEAGESQNLGMDDLKVWCIERDDLVLHGFNARLYEGQRGAQFVGEILSELSSCPVLARKVR